MNELVNWIKENKDEKYRLFSSKLVNSKYPLLGVRIPKLKEKAKQLVQQKDIEAFKEINDDSFEEIMLQGMIIAYSALNISEKEQLLYNHLVKCDNWSHIDTLVSCFKLKEEESEYMYQLLKKWRNDTNPYVIRFILVMYIHYIEKEDHVDEILDYCFGLKRDEYSIKMANAWLLQVVSINHFENVTNNIEQLDQETRKYYKRKMLDSYKIEKWKKEMIRKYV